MFWLVCAAMTAATLALVLAPIMRPPAKDEAKPELALYRAQLAEVDRDVARHVVTNAEAESVRAEIGRRLIAAARTGSVAVDHGPSAILVSVVATTCLCGLAGGLYWTVGAPGVADLPLQTRIQMAADARATRPSQQAAEATARAIAPPEVSEDYLASVAQLRQLVPARGDDLQGWELLAYHEARLRNFSAAAAAQERVVAIKGDVVTPDELLRHADLLVAAADGYVSPEAEAVVRRLLDQAPNSVAARYYLGAMFDQTDRPDIAFRLWRSIVESGAPDSLYADLARQQVTGAAFRAGVTYTAPAPVADLPGPSAEDMAAASDMAPEDRTAMIENMVSGLAARLAEEGGTAAEWARLITAYGVLGRSTEARQVLAEAKVIFQSSADALATLNAAEDGLPAAQ